MKNLKVYLALSLFTLSLLFSLSGVVSAFDPNPCVTCAGAYPTESCDEVTIGYGCKWVNGHCEDGTPC